MTRPLMPKATAVWLVENTSLTFGQISDFCGLHPLEVQAIADQEVAIGLQGLDPLLNGVLTKEEIERCSGDPSLRLQMAKPSVVIPKAKQKGARYTPVSRRQDRPDAISWLLKNFPELSDAQMSKLVGTTKATIETIRNKTHWNMTNIKPRNPVPLGLCSAETLEKAVDVARARAGTVHGTEPSAKTKADAKEAPAALEIKDH